MNITSVFFVLIIVCLMSEVVYANDTESDATTSAADNSESGIDEFLRLLARPWKKKPLKELVKDKEGRSKVRKFVFEVRSAYQKALAECRGDPVYLNEILRQRWDYQMSYEFRLRGFSESDEAESVRNTYTNLLPYPLQYSDFRTFEHDPYIDDTLFFDHLFNLRVSWRSFDIEDNLLRAYHRYRELWLQRYSESNTLLSEAIYLWLEFSNIDRPVALVTEWELYGITTDQLDTYKGEFPSNVVPPYVADILENDHHHQIRMFQHDLAKTSRLFFGLPEGTRLPSNVPKAEVSFSDAQKNLAQAATKLDSYKGDKGRADLAKVVNQYLRAIQEAIKDVVPPRNSANDSNEICPSEEPTCSKWESDNEASKVMQCTATEIQVTNSEGRVSRIEGNHSPSRDSGVFSGASSRSNSRSSPRRFNLDLNRLQSGMDLFSENGESSSDSLEQAAISALITRYTLDELFEDCMDLPAPKKQKRDLHGSPVVGRYKKSDDCKKRINVQARSCAKMIHKRVEDPITLISKTADKHVLNLKNFTVSCKNDQVLHLTNAKVWLPDFFKSFFKTVFLFTVPVIFFAGNRDDMGRKSLEVLRNNCNNKNKCNVPVDIEKASDHTTVYNLELEVEYDCAPRGCNPNLYPQYTFTVNQDEAMIWQCNKDDEGIYFTSVKWEKKSGFENTITNWFTRGLPDDSDGKSLQYLKRHCNGRFRCDQMAILFFLTGVSSGVQATFTVNYKCLPCKQFLWKNYNN